MSLMPFLKGEYSYDQARETLKQVDVDASGHVELDDYVQLMAILKEDSHLLPHLHHHRQFLETPPHHLLLFHPNLKPPPPIPTANSKNKTFLGVKHQVPLILLTMKKELNLQDTLTLF